MEAEAGLITSRARRGVCIATSVLCLLYLLHAFDSPIMFLTEEQVRSILLCGGLITTFLYLPASKGGRLLVWYDIPLIGIALVQVVYQVAFFSQFVDRWGMATRLEVALASLTVLALLEAVRRHAGWYMVAIVGFFIVHGFFGDHFPGFLLSVASSPERVMGIVWIGEEGIYSSILGIVPKYIFIFFFFGALLTGSGISESFANLGLSIFGRFTGGAAKGAVIGSGLFGMVSGSGAANVITTGVITIPLMKKTGFKAHVAGAVEAVASNGGALMPPVMGAGAFVIANIVGVSYWKVCTYAIIPAIAYYTVLYVAVDLEARHLGIHGMASSDLPPLGRTLKEAPFLLIPLLVLVYFLAVREFPAQVACLYATAALFVVSWCRKSTRITPKVIVSSLEDAARGMTIVTVICAAAGLMVGLINLSGIGVRLSSGLVYYAGGQLWALLLLAAVACLILGMGIGGLPSYLVTAVLTAPAIYKITGDLLAAHMFVFYYSLIGYLTPPVCTVAFVAAELAGAPPFKTGFTSMRLALAIYFVPFATVYTPTLTWHGSVLEILRDALVLLLGGISASVALSPYKLGGRLQWAKKTFLCSAGMFLMISPAFPGTNAVSVVIVLFLLWQLLRGRLQTGSDQAKHALL